MYLMEEDQTLSGQPLSPSPHIRSHTLPLPCQLLRVLFNGFLSTFGGCMELSEPFNVSHSQLWFCSHHLHHKRSFLAHNSQWQPGSWTSAWFLETAWTMNINMGSGSNTDHRPHSTWCPLAARTTDINAASSHGPWWEHWWQSSHVGRFYRQYKTYSNNGW